MKLHRKEWYLCLTEMELDRRVRDREAVESEAAVQQRAKRVEINLEEARVAEMAAAMVLEDLRLEVVMDVAVARITPITSGISRTNQQAGGRL